MSKMKALEPLISILFIHGLDAYLQLNINKKSVFLNTAILKIGFYDKDLKSRNT